MNSHIVVGIGNIYACESLFLSGIHPKQAANTIPAEQLQQLTQHIKKVLKKAIKAGGTTLKDFQGSDGKPGYFQQQLNVYGREHQPCLHCTKGTIQNTTISQRSSFYCNHCQCPP